MENQEGMRMSKRLQDRDSNENTGFGGGKPEDERALLLTSDKEKSNGSSMSVASYRSMLAINKDSKEYPSIQEIDRNQYMDNATSWSTSLIHLLKGNIGIGALGLPFAMMNSGIVVGPILLLVTTSIVVHCMFLVIQCSHAFCERTKSLNFGYAQVAGMSIALYYPEARHLGSKIVNTLLVITQFGFCCVYLIFVGENLKQIFDDLIQLDLRAWIGILLLPTILLSFIRTLKVMAVTSMLSNILYFIGVVCILIYAADTMQNPQTLPKFTGLATVPLAYGVIVFSLEGIGVVIPVENAVASPRYFRYALGIAMSIVTVLYLLISIFGFSSCGMHCLGSFTLSLPNTRYYAAVKGSFALSLYLSYFLQFYVPMSIIIPSVQEKIDHKYSSLADYGIRTLFVCTNAALAIGIPELGDMISLVGAVGCTSLAMIFPATIHILTFSYDDRLSTVSLIKDLIIIAFGILGSISGMYASIIAIIWDMHHPGLPQGATLSNSSHASL